MTQQEIANKVDLTNMTSGSVQTDTEYYLNVISNIMTSLLYQANAIVEAGEK